MKLARGSIINTLSAGLFAGLITVILSISYASLIFSAELAPFLGHGIAFAITSLIVVGFIQTFWSGSTHLVVQVDDDTAPVIALFIGFLVASLPSEMPPEQILSYVLAAIVISTFVAGLTLALVGYFRLGNLLQFLPYSAIGGYFAAVGWLLLIGAINSLVPYELDNVDTVLTLFTNTQILIKWLPALLIAIALKSVSHKVDVGQLLTFAVIGVTATFYTVAFVTGTNVTQLEEGGFLIGHVSNLQTSLFTPITNIDWAVVEFGPFLNNIASIATISLIALLSFTLCISAVALSTRKELDPNKELQVSGTANMLGALCGGMFTLPAVSTSTLTYELHPSPSRYLGLISIAVALLVFYLGLDLLAYIPKMVLGILLIYIALGLLQEWLVKAYKKFGAREYSVIPAILVVSIFYGFLASILFGTIAAIVLFAINYSQIGVVKYQASGSELKSNLMRSPEQIKHLRDHGKQIRLFKLQGFLFFGTAGTVYKEVMASISKAEQSELNYIILDFSQVFGVDSSATLNIERLAQRLKENNTFLILTGLKLGLLDKLVLGGFEFCTSESIQEFLDIDQGLEWCENRILMGNGVESNSVKGALELIAGNLDSNEIEKLKRYLVKRSVTHGELLTDFGQESNEVYLLESCTANAYILDSDNIERRVDGAGRGAIYGEIGFFLNIPRTAIVRADSPGELYSLSYDSLKKMESENPKLATAINRYMLKVVTERLASTTRSLRTVL